MNRTMKTRAAVAAIGALAAVGIGGAGLAWAQNDPTTSAAPASEAPAQEAPQQPEPDDGCDHATGPNGGNQGSAADTDATSL